MMKNVPCVILILVLAVAEFVQMEYWDLTSTISIQVLDTSLGVAAANVTVMLYKLLDNIEMDCNKDACSINNLPKWTKITNCTTEKNGRCPWMNNYFGRGQYKIYFDTSNYFNRTHKKFLYNFVEIFVECKFDQHYHIPLLLNPFGYSTYRGFEEEITDENMVNTEKRTISTYVLDTSLGKAVANLPLILYKFDTKSYGWKKIVQAYTINNGGSPNLVYPDLFEPGEYKLYFNTTDYFKRSRTKSLYPFVEVAFSCRANRHYHIPLLLNPFGYSTYRVIEEYSNFGQIGELPNWYKEGGTILTHVLDTSIGKGVNDITIILYKFQEHPYEWVEVRKNKTNHEGLSPEFFSKQNFETGLYKFKFNTAEYFERSRTRALYPYVEVTFSCESKKPYYIPLLLSPFGYSTYGVSGTI